MVSAVLCFVPLFLLFLGELIALLPGVTGDITTLRVDALVVTEVVTDETGEVFFFASSTGCPVQLTINPLGAALAALLTVCLLYTSPSPRDRG